MSKVYLFHDEDGSPVYRARKKAALQDAREVSRNIGSLVEVTEIGVRNDLPKMILVEKLLNKRNWGSGFPGARIAAYRQGKEIKGWADEPEPELENAA